MKSKKSLLLLVATGVLTFAALVGCNKPADKSNSNPAPTSSGTSDVSGSNSDAQGTVTGVAFAEKSFKVAPGAAVELNAVVSGEGAFDKRVSYSLPAGSEGLFSIDEDNVLHVVKGVEPLGKSVVVTAASVADPTKTDTATVEVLEGAQGYADYTALKGKDKAPILGALEKYAVDNFLTGITFMGTGGYVMYADNIVKGTNTYIPGYGFGALAEGRITKPLTGPAVIPEYALYWHDYITEDPLALLVMNEQGSDVSDLVSYTTTSYWDVKMSDTKDSYTYFPDTAKVARPIAVNPDANGMSTTWKFPVKVGEELKYNTNSKVERFKKYNGRQVALEDYVTPYKIYFTKAYGLKRSAENLDKSTSIAGAQEYYNASESGFNAEAWANIGIKSFVDETDGLSYLQFTVKSAKLTPFEAMTTFGGGMFQPVPEEFILDCGGAGNTSLVEGVKYWGYPNADSTELPSDHWLATGPYAIDVWNKNTNIVFKKNPYYADGGRYQIAGLHYNVFPAAKADEEAAFNEFIDGNLSAAGIPTSKLSQYKNDPRTTKTAGSSTFALNLNTCTEELWEEMFGVNGTIKAHASKSDYWPIKPAMSNKNFLKGMSYAINRNEFGETVGRVGTCEYFADAFLIDPEEGLSYNRTQAHKDAIADFIAGTDGAGFSFELAKKSFKAAADELIENGDYDIGDTINLKSFWQADTDENRYGKVIINYIETAFKAAETGLKLKIDSEHGETYMYAYNAMMEGKFDIGFGGLTMDLNTPLENMEVLKSDNSSGYTLNWGMDTNEVDGSIVYDGKVWSFDGLWNAACNGAIVKDGANAPLSRIIKAEVERKATGDLVLYLWMDLMVIDDNNFAEVTGVCLYATNDTDGNTYKELYVLYNDENNFKFDEEKGCYVVTFAAADITEWLATYANPVAQGIDVHVVEVINGSYHSPSGYKYYYLDEGGTVVGSYLGTCWEGAIPAIPAP